MTDWLKKPGDGHSAFFCPILFDPLLPNLIFKDKHHFDITNIE